LNVLTFPTVTVMIRDESYLLDVSATLSTR
jgi:hypothetical protein